MKRFATVLLLLAVFAVALAAASDAEDPGVEMPGVVQMTKATFDQLVGKKQGALVEFYAPWCGHCKHMVPEFTSLGAAFQKSKNAKDLVVIGKVDATVERDLGKRFDVKGFPTILYFPPGSQKPVQYEGGRTADEFSAFLKDKIKDLHLTIPQEVQYAMDLTNANFDAVAKDPSKAVMVMFYAPWCGHCKALKPKFSQLAKIYENDADVVIARINADEQRNKAIAAEYGIKAFPTLMFFGKGADAKPEEFKKGRELEDFLMYINEKAGTHRLVNGDLSWDHGVIEELTKSVAAVAKSTGDAAKEAVEKVKAEAAKVAEKESEAAAYYAKAAERVAEKGSSWVSSELSRLQRTLEGAVTGARRDNMLKRVNILTAIQKEMK